MEISTLVGLCVVVLSAVLQSTALSQLSFLGQRLDLVLLVIVSVALLRGAWSGLVWGLVGGLALDFLTVLPFGSHTVAMGLVGLLVGLGLRRVSQDYPVLPFVATPLVTTVFYLISGVAISASGWPVDWQWMLGRVLLPVVVLDTVALPLVYIPVYTISRRTRVEINWQPDRL